MAADTNGTHQQRQQLKFSKHEQYNNITLRMRLCLIHWGSETVLRCCEVWVFLHTMSVLLNSHRSDRPTRVKLQSSVSITVERLSLIDDTAMRQQNRTEKETGQCRSHSEIRLKSLKADRDGKQTVRFYLSFRLESHLDNK